MIRLQQQINHTNQNHNHHQPQTTHIIAPERPLKPIGENGSDKLPIRARCSALWISIQLSKSTSQTPAEEFHSSGSPWDCQPGLATKLGGARMETNELLQCTGKERRFFQVTVPAKMFRNWWFSSHPETSGSKHSPWNEKIRNQWWFSNTKNLAIFLRGNYAVFIRNWKTATPGVGPDEGMGQDGAIPAFQKKLGHSSQSFCWSIWIGRLRLYVRLELSLICWDTYAFWERFSGFNILFLCWIPTIYG